MPVIMGTAGHIDHGKTSLVKALTGIDCDRLEEEKRRGITIELGFAYLDLPGGRRLGVVDVPGHERFVKNMVAGAAGIDFVTLVIAADEGVMPQTREHLEICTLLGVKTGLVALTKIDMVEPEWLEMVTEDVRGFLAGTFLAEAPIMPVSSHTRQGLDELRAAIAAMADGITAKRRSDLFRLPVDRVFTMKGHGTVVTGTLISGKVGVGDDVEVFPSGRRAKVRNLQSHGASSESVLAGQRTAVNLAGVELDEVERGQTIGRPGSLFPSQVWDVELTALKSMPRPLKHRKEIHFHHGSKEALARVYLLDREQLEPGQTAICQVRFAEPMVGVHGDRCVIRSFSPLRTIAGGKLLNPLGRKVKRFSPDVAKLAALGEAPAEELVLGQLDLAGDAGLSFAELLTLTNLESRDLEKVLQTLSNRQQAAMYDREGRVYVQGERLGRLADGLLGSLKEFHRKEPLKQGVSRGELASGWGRPLPPKLIHFLLERLVKKGEIVAEAELVRLPGHKVSLASDQAKLRESILTAFEKGGETPPNLKDVLDPLGLEFKEAAPVFKLLTEEGGLVRINEDMYYHAPAFESLKAKVVDYFASHEEMGPNELRELTGLTRKYAIPVLERFDKDKLTIRVGDKRRLRKR